MRTYFPKPGNMLYPVPAVMVTVAGSAAAPAPDMKGAESIAQRDNIITVAWAGTVCSDPPMVSISVRKNRFSHPMLMQQMEFAVNLVNEPLLRACDYCGCTTGAKVDKFERCRLTREKAAMISAPLIAESPVSLECRVTQVIELGSHDLFLARVLAVKADERYMDEKNVFHLEKAGLIAYSHGRYHALGDILGTFGYSVRRAPRKKRKQ